MIEKKRTAGVRSSWVGNGSKAARAPLGGPTENLVRRAEESLRGQGGG